MTENVPQKKWVNHPRYGWMPTTDCRPSPGMAALIRQARLPNAELRYDLWIEQDRKCYYCGEAMAFENGNTEHKQPRSKGGPNVRENLAFTCVPCNSEKGSRTEVEYRRAKGLTLTVL